VKWEHSEWITQLDKDIHDCILKRNACKKGWQEEDESTIESSKVDEELKNLCGFDDLFGVINTCIVYHTGVKQISCLICFFKIKQILFLLAFQLFL